ncbi:type IV-A pilus assembly ATPase PilB [Legionella clemsonensis]|uniref:Type II secretion system protein E n=1 Tax=Legionella clemsonensis TaxID=1867846 RepID=A0A222P288_9GAMM|nr:type IV-A pilus assembly ATPase PilB [Legionella clemsonensis]ASQ45875.1 Type II secretion system protein E [Legionella clemsonensis]
MERIQQEQQHLSLVAQLINKNNLISEKEIAQYQQNADQADQSLQNYLVTNNIVSELQIALLLAEHFNIPYLNIDSVDIELIPWRLITDRLMRRLHVAPLMLRENHLILATDYPTQTLTKEIQFYTGLTVTLAIAETSKLNQLIEKIYQRKLSEGPTNYKDYSMQQASSNLSVEVKDCSEDDASIVNFVDSILFDAIKRKASDIHFETYENYYRIRYRMDGVLTEIATPPIDLAQRITARIKIMANLDISERRIPQDGRFNVRFSENTLRDCRINSCPTINGEKVVIRILNSDTPKINIESLGFNKRQEKYFLDAIAKPQGMILVTGPTGSGKTVSLYAALSLLNTQEKNISTAEDPVEIKLSGINQVNINTKAGLTFAKALRAFLRQDPDVMMIGEIRDFETAEMAIKAAQTGHLILSTLHTNSAAETLTRLANLGVSPFNIASSLTLLIAQRLVRRLCQHCKQIQSNLTTHQLEQFGLNAKISSIPFFKAKGCKYCFDGYKGRVGIFEVMPVSPAIERLILTGKDTDEILKQAKKEGMLTIYQSGLEKIKEGITTLEELNRVVIQ